MRALRLQRVDHNRALQVAPPRFRWKEFPDFVDSATFGALCADFPLLDCFEKHEGLPQGPRKNRRPHDRYYLALDSSVYVNRSGMTPVMGKGVIERSSLGSSWQSFIKDLEAPFYRAFIAQFLGVSSFRQRYAWHMAYSGCEISPHIDDSQKLGTHLFYFNKPGEWQPEWGGQTLILEDLQRDVDNPEFDDFSLIHQVSNVGNNSLIWRNSPNAWHGVRPLSSPDGQFRRVFTVVFTPDV